MKLAFCLFNYFPYGGLQRDFLRIAKTCVARGHEVHVYTMEWEGARDPQLPVHLIEVAGWQNHTRSRQFAEAIKPHLAQYDLVIGFNKMPYLDIYYAADVCYAARIHRERSWFYRFTPRYRQWHALEKAVFERGQSTQVMLISLLQENEFKAYYATESKRFHLLPPGIAKDRIAPANANEIRERVREVYQLKQDDYLVLMVGSGFKTKGVDRALHALASLSDERRRHSRLFIIGQDHPEPFQRLATQLNIADQVTFLGGRPDVPDFLLAADLLIHPSYHENTGTALLEALVAGLPVLTVSTCGYAHYITEADAGMVVPAPFNQQALNHSLEKMLSSQDRAIWRQNALTCAKQTDLYSLPEKAADLIEDVGKKRVSAS